MRSPARLMAVACGVFTVAAAMNARAGQLSDTFTNWIDPRQRE
jgi:hypothetical protein